MSAPSSPPERTPPDDREPEAADERAEQASHTCEVCGAVMYERHCKIVCPRCGYTRDCSDP